MEDKKILFISEKSIKSNSIIEENLESKLIRLSIKEVQDLELFPILGKELYEKISNQIYDNLQDETYEFDVDIKELLDFYIKDFLIYSVLLNITTSLNYKYTNKGTLSITDAYAVNIVGGNIENVKKHYRSRYDSYRKRLVDYINKSCGGNTVVAPFSTGFYLTNSVNKADLYKAKSNKTGL